jgi:hypothetical protein
MSARRPRNKIKLPRWISPSLRSIVRLAASRRGLKRVEALLFVEGQPGARVNAVHAVGAGALAEFYDDPWPAAVHAQGGSILLVFEHLGDAREAERDLNAAYELGLRLRLALVPAEGRA